MLVPNVVRPEVLIDLEETLELMSEETRPFLLALHAVVEASLLRVLLAIVFPKLGRPDAFLCTSDRVLTDEGVLGDGEETQRPTLEEDDVDGSFDGDRRFTPVAEPTVGGLVEDRKMDSRSLCSGLERRENLLAESDIVRPWEAATLKHLIRRGSGCDGEEAGTREVEVIRREKGNSEGVGGRGEDVH